MILTGRRWLAPIAALALACGGPVALAQPGAAQRDVPQARDAARNAETESGPAAASPDETGSTRPADPAQIEPGAEQGNGRSAGGQRRVELGIAVAPSRGEGVLVADVRPDSPAEQAGLEPGDYILSVADQEVRSPRELTTLIERAQEGQELVLTIWRDGEEQTLQVTPAARQQAGFRGERRGDGQEPAQQAWLGVLLADEPTEQGIAVTQVFPSGPASRANLRAGDVITSINGDQVRSAEDVTRIIGEAQPGSEATVGVVRRNEERQITVRLGSRADFLGDFGGMDEQFGQSGEFPENFGDFGGGIPEHAIMLEYQRRQTEHIQRLERVVRELATEVRELRQQMQGDAPQAGGERPDGVRAAEPRAADPPALSR